MISSPHPVLPQNHETFSFLLVDCSRKIPWQAGSSSCMWCFEWASERCLQPWDLHLTVMALRCCPWSHRLDSVFKLLSFPLFSLWCLIHTTIDLNLCFPMNYQNCFAYSDLIPTIIVMDANCHLSLLSPSVWLCRAFWLQILAAPSSPATWELGRGKAEGGHPLCPAPEGAQGWLKLAAVVS